MNKKFSISFASAIAMALLIIGVVAGMTVGGEDGVWEYVEDTGDGSADCDNWGTGNGTTITAWSQTAPSIQNNVLYDENQVRYGSPYRFTCPWDVSGFIQQSGFGYIGTSDLGAMSVDTPLALGRATHYNNPIYTPSNNSLDWVDLDVIITGVKCGGDVTPAGGSTYTYIFRVYFDETPNTPPCAYGPEDGPCNDKITVATISSLTQQIDCTSSSVPTDEQGTYTLQILGIMRDLDGDGDCTDQTYSSANLMTEFITEEGAANYGCVYGILTDFNPTAVTLKSFTAQEEGTDIELNWETITETNTLGFNIFRSTTRNGTQLKLNSDIIFSNAAPGSNLGETYQFVDRQVVEGAQYFYWLQEVEVDGGTTSHGPAEFIE